MIENLLVNFLFVLNGTIFCKHGNESHVSSTHQNLLEKQRRVPNWVFKTGRHWLMNIPKIDFVECNTAYSQLSDYI